MDKAQGTIISLNFPSDFSFMDNANEQKPNPVRDKSFAFALRIVQLYKYLTNEKQEYILSKYLLNAGTHIGAQVEAAQQAPERHDFQREMGIALQHAAKTQYWLKLLSSGSYLTQAEFDSIIADADELARLLTAIVKSSKRTS
jgi:four helix bundle protein